jgi:hypothetical protein
MKYQVGDTVLILHSNEEGQVVDIIDNKMMMVQVKGVTFPVYMDQVEFPYFKRFTEKKPFNQRKEKKYVDDVRKEKPSTEQRIADGVWLTFLPVMDTDEFGDEVVDELKLHLINRTETAYKFTYKLHFFGRPDFDLRNEIKPFENFYLHDIPFSDLSDSPSFEFEFSLLTPDKTRAPYFEASLRLKPKQLFTRIEDIRKKNEATFSHRLFEKYPDRQYEDTIELGRLAAKGFKVYDAKRVKEHLEPARSVVDLHIEKITDDWKRLSNYEILGLQLKTFEKYYELALAHHQPSLVVIHGVGEGKLRDEIHDILRLKKEVKSFVNQYDPRFGYGATEIYFQY